MDGSGTFTQLAAALSLDERKSLLEKLTSQSNISENPLYQVSSEPVEDLEKRFERLPWYYRFWLFILSLFKGDSPFRIFQGREVVKIGRLIEETVPGLYDYHRGLLLPEFHRELTGLKESSRFFYTALDSSINRDKGEFYIFLGSLEMTNIHSRLTAETDPARLANNNSDITDVELRQTALSVMEGIFGEITEEERTAMYANARSLNCLRQLSSFLFDRVIMAFSNRSAEGGMTCPGAIVKEMLVNLNNILYSLRKIPSMALLESLFIFVLQEHVGEPGFNINVAINTLLSQAGDSLAAIRAFNRQVPLTLITRCIARDAVQVPVEISGGEDWFLVYRDYWRRQVEERIAGFLRARRYHDLQIAYQSFFGGTNLKTLENAVSESNPDGLPVQGTYGLSFLFTFYSVVFIPDINRFLRPVLIDGDFYQRETRLLFTANYNELINLDEVIAQFDKEISPEGEWGKRYAQVQGEMTSIPVKRRKMALILEEASEAAAGIFDRTREAMIALAAAVTGILRKDSAGKYEVLANMPRLAGKGPEFEEGLTASLAQLKQAVQIMEDIGILEAGK